MQDGPSSMLLSLDDLQHALCNNEGQYCSYVPTVIDDSLVFNDDFEKLERRGGGAGGG